MPNATPSGPVTPSEQAYRPSKETGPGQKRIFNPELFELVSGTAYTALMTNLLIVLTCAPFIVLLMTTDPVAAWPALVLSSILIAPALTGAFAAFQMFSNQDGTSVIRTFFRAWWHNLRRSLPIGIGLAAVLFIIMLNLQFFLTERLGALIIPIQVMLLVVAVVTALISLVGIVELPGVPLRDVLKNAILLGVRKWYLTVPALVVLGLLIAIIVQQPAIGLGVMLAPFLYAIWGACRYALKPILVNDEEPAS